MSLNESDQVGLKPSEVQMLRNELQQNIGDSKASLLRATRIMGVEIVWNEGQFESGRAEGRNYVGGSPTGAGPTAVG